MLYIILALIMFGLLIAVHEFGHFAAAKLFGIQVNEFSIGMGPALLKKQKGDTLYSLRLFPVGGYCAMEGEDEEASSDNPRAFGNAAGWKQAIVLVAGAFMNFLTGLLIVLILYAGAAGFRVPTYGGAIEGYGTENCGLQEGDRILSVDGHAILVYSNVSLYLSRAGDDVDFVVERDGERLELDSNAIPGAGLASSTACSSIIRWASLTAITTTLTMRGTFLPSSPTTPTRGRQWRSLRAQVLCRGSLWSTVSQWTTRRRASATEALEVPIKGRRPGAVQSVPGLFDFAGQFSLMFR